MKFGTLNLLLILFLAGCGGGGGSTTSATPSTDFAYSSNHPCISNEDTMPGLQLMVPKDNIHGCQIASNIVFDGLHSLKITVNPTDCYSLDCTSDRSRYEVHDNVYSSTNGQTVKYQTNLYIPSQHGFRPRGTNALFLTQINLKNSNGLYHTLAYLEVDQNSRLVLRTHQGFTWTILNQHLLTANIFDRWISVDYEIKSSTTDGYVKVWVDNTLLVQENIPTLQTTEDYVSLKVGIYNAFKSSATEPYATQTVYFDGIKRSY